MNKINFYYPYYYCLNNLSAHEVKYQGIFYKTAEHAYQSQKFLDKKLSNLVSQAPNPLAAKNIAHRYDHQVRPNWEKIKISVMEKIVLAKIKQHSEVLKALKDSAHHEIVENSPDDYFWGIGKKQTGHNHMGKILMKLRERLA